MRLRLVLILIGRRLALLVVQVVCCTAGFTLTFFYLSPHAAGQVLLPRNATARQAAAFVAASPVHKYWDIVAMWLSGNLGYSPDAGYEEPLTRVISNALPFTLVLTVSAIVLGLLLGVPIGITRAYRHGGSFDRVAGVVAVVFSAAPAFLIGQWLVDGFTIGTSIPAEGPQTYGFAAIFTDWRGMLLPIASITLGFAGRTVQVVRSLTMDQLVSEYVRVARAYGASGWRVLHRQLARNIAGPLVTYIGLAFPYLLSGVVVVEALFNIRGLGFDLIAASGGFAPNPPIPGAFYFDIELTILLVIIVLMLLTVLVADVLAAALDPRLPR